MMRTVNRSGSRRAVNRTGSQAQMTSVPAPVGGWNTRDSLDGMNPVDAVTMDNMFPTVGKVTSRKGYASHATNMGSSNVDTIAEYHAGSTRKLIAGANNILWDATATGSATALASGFTSNQWQWASFNGYLIMVNGSDAPQSYEGTTMSAAGFTGSGLTPSDLNTVTTFKNRLFFTENNSQDFWYGAVNAITGTLTKFPLSRIGQFGGNLMAIATWTLDAGDGVDDLAVFVMTSGEVIVYQGTDPSDATAWALVGVYRIGVPISSRAITKVAGDLMIATTDDYVSLSTVLKTGQLGQSSKLSGAVQAAHANVGSIFGWQAQLHRSENMLLFNVPLVTGTSVQHVLNTTTGAACRFTDMPARCWGEYNGDLYFGSIDGVIYKYTGVDDNGADIDLECKQAWNSFNSPYRKRLAAVRPILESQGTLTFGLGIGYDFVDALTVAESSVVTSLSLWDIAEWDVDYWAGDNVASGSWRAISGTGQNMSVRLKIATQQTVSWLRTDYRIETGKNL